LEFWKSIYVRAGVQNLSITLQWSED
jgi:hypothetical protein